MKRRNIHFTDQQWEKLMKLRNKLKLNSRAEVLRKLVDESRIVEQSKPNRGIN